MSPEFIHKIVQVFDRMCTRISKEIDKIKAEKTFDLRERLEKLGVSYIGPVAKALLGIISCQINRGADKQEFASEINLLKNAIAEFNIENIMAFMTRDSQQEFEESDRMKLAKLEEEYKKLQEESKNELNAAKQREQKLTKDLQNEKSKVDLYQGRASLSEGHAGNVEKELESLKQLMDQINIDIEQSRGLPIRRWRALKEMFQKLFDKFGNIYSFP